MRLIRVFPRRTRATPIDSLAYCGPPDFFAEADVVHISVAFTWDLPKAEWLEKQWRQVAPVTIGGPALGKVGGPFVPGRYLRHGYTITSRGCPNRCWFCSVWRRESKGLNEFSIMDGWNVLDDNLLACSEDHIRAVFRMLARQGRRVEFTGGLEAARLQDWHVDLLADLHPRPNVFFAYDTSDDLEPLIVAGAKMFKAGFTRESHRLRCYVLIGYQGDTITKANNRLNDAMWAGFMPMAMLYRDATGKSDAEWRRFQRSWARPALIAARNKDS